MYVKTQISFVVLLLLSARCISVSTSLEDLTCEPGEYPPYGFTSGSASQCSGLSKITTAEECILAAAYNRRNNIDKNGGFGGRWSLSGAPPGCIYISENHKYYWNDFPTSTGECSDNLKCICKPKTCTKCPRHTYSEGGTNPTCTPCPTETPYTLLNSKLDSKSSCKSTLECIPGEGMLPTDIRISGHASQCSGLSKITTEAECELAAEYNRENNIDKNVGYEGRLSLSNKPPG